MKKAHSNNRREEAPSADERAEGGAVAWFLERLRTFAGWLIVDLTLLWLAPALPRRATEALQARPLPSLGWGAL